jgi:hypothetical protein
VEIRALEPPRRIRVGNVDLADCGELALAPDELVTLVTEDGSRWDVGRKEWGYYATPSTNRRLAGEGLRTVLASGREDKLFVLIVERGKEASFETYLEGEEMRVVAWLDDDASVQRLLEHTR